MTPTENKADSNTKQILTSLLGKVRESKHRVQKNMNLQQEEGVCIKKDKKSLTIMNSLFAYVRESNKFLKDLVKTEDNVNRISDNEFKKYLLPSEDKKDSGIVDVDSDSFKQDL